MLSFEGRLDIEINGEAASLTGERSELVLEARRPLHFLLSAGIRPKAIPTIRRFARRLSESGTQCSVTYRGKKIASIGAGVNQNLPARLLGIEHARFGPALATLFRRTSS